VPLKRLEPDEGKLSCPVLRGDWRSNAPPYPTIVKALFAIVIPPIFVSKVLFMMLQIRPVGVVHFHPESLVHFTPVRVAHFTPESVVHYSPVEVVHYTPVCSTKLCILCLLLSSMAVNIQSLSPRVLKYFAFTHRADLCGCRRLAHCQSADQT